MTDGVIKSQGTRIFFATAASEIHSVACATGVTGIGGGSTTEINSTCLSSVVQEFVRGLRDNGSATIPINFIPRSAAHQALIDLDNSGVETTWMIVMSDQAGSPVGFDSDDMLESPGPTSLKWRGFVSSVPLDFATDDLVRGTVTIRISGALEWDFPTADLA